MKEYISRNIKYVGGQTKTFVDFMMRAVSQEDTRDRFEIENVTKIKPNSNDLAWGTGKVTIDPVQSIFFFK